MATVDEHVGVVVVPRASTSLLDDTCSRGVGRLCWSGSRGKELTICTDARSLQLFAGAFPPTELYVKLRAHGDPEARDPIGRRHRSAAVSPDPPSVVDQLNGSASQGSLPRLADCATVGEPRIDEQEGVVGPGGRGAKFTIAQAGESLKRTNQQHLKRQ